MQSFRRETPRVSEDATDRASGAFCQAQAPNTEVKFRVMQAGKDVGERGSFLKKLDSVHCEIVGAGDLAQEQWVSHRLFPASSHPIREKQCSWLVLLYDEPVMNDYND